MKLLMAPWNERQFTDWLDDSNLTYIFINQLNRLNKVHANLYLLYNVVVCRRIYGPDDQIYTIATLNTEDSRILAKLRFDLLVIRLSPLPEYWIPERSFNGIS